MPDVPMPRLSDSMEEGTILRWLVEDGAEVARGQEIAEIETDKATMTYEADLGGVLRVMVAEGETVPVGQSIATIGEAAGAGAPSASPSPAAAPAPAAPAGAAAAAPAPAVGAPAPAAGAPAAAAPAPAPRANGAAPAASDVSASPVARRLARSLGVDLAGVTGSGPQGRIVKADVRAAGEALGSTTGATHVASAPPQPLQAPAPAPAAPAPAAPAPPAPGTGSKGETVVEELSRLQSVVARRMSESKATVPDFAISVDVDMTEALALRQSLKAMSDAPPSVNDLVVKATALALRRHPRANGSYKDGRFELHGRVNVGVAVAAQEALVVPTVFDADTKSLGAIAADVRRLAGRVRDGSVTPPELGGGTFTVSNLGMYGVDRFTGIVNPPQAGILCVGAIVERPVAVDGEVVVRPVMTLTLACDHRILYGADAAQFLAEVRRLLEAPMAMAL